MKKSILYIIAASALVLTSCDDLLDKNPRDTFTNTPAFWSNNNMVESYCNRFYAFYGGASNFYFNNLNDDQVSPSFADWTFKTIPNTASAWSSRFTNIRRINYLLDGLKSSSLPAATKARYEGIGRLNRAYIYSELVKMYGDVQWEDRVILDTKDEAVKGERTDQDVVMDSVLNDLNYAVANIPSNTSDKTQWSKEMALAAKSDICLFFGTYCKYRTQADNGKAPDASLAQKFLQEAASASEELMNSGKFALDAWDIAGTYESPTHGKLYTVYNSLDLSGNREVIFYKNYQKDVVSHGLCDYTCGSSTQSGLTKDAVDAFLFRDGKPKATTTLDTDDKAVRNANGDYSIAHFLKNKDPRLELLVDSVIAFKGHGWIRNEPSPDAALPSEMTSSTGYTIYKYDNPQIEMTYRTSTNGCYTDIPLYWYSVILLNYAEAKAELGTLTQADLDKSINLLQRRVNMPDLTLTPEADPANNMGVSNLIWEVRRIRRCELMCDNNYRYWDLVRWHQLDKLDTKVNTNTNVGANVTNVSDADKNAEGYLLGVTATRSYSNKYYHYPIPSDELTLNTHIQQNPNW